MTSLVTAAQSTMLDYATAAWVDLAPALVVGLEDELRALRPGTTLGGQPILATPGLLVPSAPPSASQRSSPSPRITLPPSATGASESFASVAAPSPSLSGGASGRASSRRPGKRRREKFDGVELKSRPATPAVQDPTDDDESGAEGVRIRAFLAAGPLHKTEKPADYGMVSKLPCSFLTLSLIGFLVRVLSRAEEALRAAQARQAALWPLSCLLGRRAGRTLCSRGSAG